jgi:Zn-dependent M28 family amino/carboxypeptidase
MLSSLFIASLLAADPFPYAAAEAELSEAITQEELRAHVYRLASPEFAGRRGPGGARAARHVADMFKRAGLAPAFGDSYFQDIPWLVGNGSTGGPSFVGRNVAAAIPGTDPVLKDEWIVLSAHYDHLGERGLTLFPGADDNASGVAMLIEVAEAFALAKEKPKRTVLFVSFDLEEQGLQGSAHFAAHPPRPFDRLKAFLTADLIGRSMGNVLDEYVYVLGSESSPALRRLVNDVKPENGLLVGRLGADLLGPTRFIARSDYGAFRDRQVPFLFFTTGMHPDYHQPTDLPDRIDYAKLARVSRWIRDLTRRLADEPTAPAWAPLVGTDIDEARAVLVLLDRTLDRPEKIRLSAEQRTGVEAARSRLAGIVSRGSVTPADRAWLVSTARQLLTTVYKEPLAAP